ncbi:MAG: D-alanine--D-alanine ligase [Deltaproteobacteria bacterium]|nr:D-alanine--D-alanine ligase [Deltaproteobacteria bacterium]
MSEQTRGPVAVLLGGRSAERDVSLRTGAAVAEALRRRGHTVVEIDARDDLAARLAVVRPAVAFLALHGRWGEDGTVQGLLEMVGIPYTGSGVLASALAMDKGLSKVVFRANGVPTPDFQVLKPGQPTSAIALPVPLVAKPLREGSTIGIAVARVPEEIEAAVATARACADEVLIEAFVAGREVTLGVLDATPLPLVEVVPEGGFYDYASKYTPGRTRYICPAELDEGTATRASHAGAAAYVALGCSGAARVDVLLDEQGRPWVLEVNTIPGMTPTSLLPKAAQAAGIEFDELVERILAGASLKA